MARADFSLALVAERWAWLALAGVFIAASVALFDRFESTDRRNATKTEERPPDAADEKTAWLLRPLPAVSRQRSVSWAGLLVAELRFARAAMPRWWLFAAPIAWILQLVLPLAAARDVVLPLAWIWPIAIWSALVSREARFGTVELLAASPGFPRTTVASSWAFGAATALAMACPLAIRLLLNADVSAALALAAGALFVPAFAIALGALTGTARAFEGLYAALWYIGLMQHVPALDFSRGRASGFFAASAPALLVLAVACWRRERSVSK